MLFLRLVICIYSNKPAISIVTLQICTYCTHTVHKYCTSLLPLINFQVLLAKKRDNLLKMMFSEIISAKTSFM